VSLVLVLVDDAVEAGDESGKLLVAILSRLDLGFELRFLGLLRRDALLVCLEL
jgi:hypothetical protein